MASNNLYSLSDDARDDLLGIWCYIANDNPTAADRIEAEILSSCELLAEHPHIGHQREDLTDKSLRFWSVHSYMIIYQPDTSPLDIARIISGYRDIAGLMQ